MANANSTVVPARTHGRPSSKARSATPRTNLPISKTPKAPALTAEQFAYRRRGIAAALQMLDDVMRGAAVDDSKMGDDAYYVARDRAFVTASEQALAYLRAFGSQTEHAQRGFAYIIGTFFAEIGEGSTPHPHDYDHAAHFANPPLTISQTDQPDRRPSRHNGIKLTARERAAVARSWLTACQAQARRSAR